MQRASSGVGFSDLLNPLTPNEQIQQSPQTNSGTMIEQSQGSLSPEHSPRGRQDVEMVASSPAIRPNGPLPDARPAETASNELPRPYKCPLCDKAFHRLEHQTRHIRTHTGEKPHACQFPGCSKKFSRSDELTRHSRIHNNPNGRRGAKGQQSQGMAQGMIPGMHPDMLPPPPPGPKAIRSAPSSGISSPNVSPPHSYSQYNVPPPTGIHAFNRSAAGSQSGVEISMLARAANQAERDGFGSHHPARHHPYYSHGLHPSRSHMPGLQAYHLSRSHSHHEEDDHYHNSFRHSKKSRPNSPNSTAPPSPTFSHDSLSPTPDHTPLATPAHSPRLRPFHNTYELPPFRSLSLQQHPIPALAPLEPQPDPQFPVSQVVPQSTRGPGMSLTDIIGRTDGTQRKLPVPQGPKVAVHELLGPSEGFNLSGRSSSSTSLAGGDLMERF